MPSNSVHFSIAKHAQWAPGLDSDQAWQTWLQQAKIIQETDGEPPAVKAMPAMLRRRARLLGRMALEVAYACLDDVNEGNAGDAPTEIPTIFCSRHGEVGHSIELMQAQLNEGTVSPIGFSSAVHNATAGLFSIARKDRSNHIAIAAGASSVEHAVIEACGLLNDGAKAVLLVNYEQALPPLFHHFEDCIEQAYAWAWLMVAPVSASADTLSEHRNINLQWRSPAQSDDSHSDIGSKQPNAAQLAMPPGLDVLRFYLNGQARLERQAGNQRWIWSSDDARA